MKKELQFFLKICRNAGILGGLMFVSTWATGTLTWILVKPIFVFFMGYIFSELARHYKLTPNKSRVNMTTFIF
ncbi:hypothetical protein KAR91_20505 [Candidatus Pacearchaeota archaeon]|nr:hypothetical protein [Candidatus Pacearchaeota archaeon]